jgi:hypothetical protein
MKSHTKIINLSFYYFSCTKVKVLTRLLEQQQQQQQQQPKEKEEEEETKCRFVVVRRINLPPSLSSLAHLSLGSDSRDGVLVFF